jgi:hypothetical protein
MLRALKINLHYISRIYDLFFLVKHFNRNYYSINFEKWNGKLYAILTPRVAWLRRSPVRITLPHHQNAQISLHLLFLTGAGKRIIYTLFKHYLEIRYFQ